MTGRETDQVVFPIAQNWPPSVREWFQGLMTNTPRTAPNLPPPNWEYWIESAEKHGIGSLVFNRLRTVRNEVRPPTEIFHTLRNAYFDDVARIMVRRKQLENLLKRFDKVGIKTLVLKGAALGEILYEDVFQRSTADIDILVPKEDYFRARNVMLENGYRSKRGDRTLQMEWSCDEEFMPSAADENRQYVVELHWALTSHAQLLRKIESEELFGRAEVVPGLSQNFSVLSPVDALIFACIHLFYKHINELRLIWLYDIHLLAGQIEGLGLWSAAVVRSQQWEGRLALKNCLEMARSWFGTSFPEIVTNLESHPASLEEKELYNLVIFQLKHGTRRGWLRKHLYQLSQLKGWSKIYYLHSRLFPSRQEIEANYPALRLWPGPLVHIGRIAMMFVSKK